MDSPENMSPEDVMRVELDVIRQEHRDLDETIAALQEVAAQDQLEIKRLKKKKLMLKDKISRLEDKLTPDIIA